ncbi:zinc-finger of mitochondrial splicing suppressor 51-domain-containing protein [Limtongia smithiae]|uniref:zinc-finger of mitochondrial splicing suppressor 51-domain-containing protein n=1 Tax=Limtongia smithiae TaxID=1125753 RepID=UPI0034CE8958
MAQAARTLISSAWRCSSRLNLPARRSTVVTLQQRRTFLMKAVRWTLGYGDDTKKDEPTFENRFHLWEESPSLVLRNRAATIKALARCPVTDLPIQFTCPNCGIPTHHDRAAWEKDTHHHESVCEKLALANVYEHDIRSGREFPEFEMPPPQDIDVTINFGDWDTFLYTRDFHSMDTEFEFAHATKILTYPVTVASVLHNGSPYTLASKRLTLEGLKSLAALRYTLFPAVARTRAGANTEDESVYQGQPIRLFVLGARSESQLPFEIWAQLLFVFDKPNVQIHFIGPEALFDKKKKQYVYSPDPVHQTLTPSFGVTFHTDYFHIIHESNQFVPYDPYYDVFFLFHPGLGAPEAMHMWEKSVPALLETKCAIVVTGFHEADSKRDWEWVNENFSEEMDVLMMPGKNLFGSTRWEINDMRPDDPYLVNDQIFAIRGKRYPAILRGGEAAGAST